MPITCGRLKRERRLRLRGTTLDVNHLWTVFTLEWPECLLAERLQRLFPKSEIFSVLVPTSRQYDCGTYADLLN